MPESEMPVSREPEPLSTEPVEQSQAGPRTERLATVGNEGFLSARPPRHAAESLLVRVVATIGVVAVGTALGAILVANDVAGWIVGLATSAVSVVLAALLWRSRTL